jgi:LmbE family N-acetylglucosaminyl deacetylase
MNQGYFAESTPRPAALDVPARAMTIGAHPDDAEFGAGGTLARWTAEGCEVLLLVVTDGSKGTWDHTLDPVDLVDMRREEQQRAAAVLGVTQTVMLDYPDGELEYTMELREQLCLWIRRFRPDVVLTHDPWRRYMLHPDHRVTGWAALDGVVAARDHLFFPDQLSEGLAEHRPETVLLWAPDEPDHWEDVSGTVEQKVEALLCHSSQATTTMGNADSSADRRQDFAARIQAWAQDQGTAAGLDAAESFKMIRP